VTASGDWTAAARALHAALALWRGEPLADVPFPPSRQGDRVWLTESRLQALQSRIEADLHLGRHNELVPELCRSDPPPAARYRVLRCHRH
jgi:Bacterial transcriptional activator domain